MGKVVKVVFAIESLSVGGAERLVVELANRIDRSRFSPHVLCIGKAGVMASELHNVPLAVLEKRPGFDYSIIKKISHYLHDIQPEIINSHLWTANTWCRIAAGKNIRFFATEHNRDIWKKWYHKMIDRWLMHKSSIIAVSDDVANFYMSDICIPEAKIKTIYNGIDIESFRNGEGWRIRGEFDIPEDAPLVGYIGRIEKQKNIPRMLEAFGMILQKIPQSFLLIAGDGSEIHNVHSIAKAKPYSDRIIFAGSRSDIADVLDSFDVFILASNREGHPLTVMEAQSAGVPVVATAVGGTAKAIACDENSRGGITVPANANAIAESVVKLLLDEELRTRYGQFAATYASDNFNIQNTVAEYEKVFAEAAGI